MSDRRERSAIEAPGATTERSGEGKRRSQVSGANARRLRALS